MSKVNKLKIDKDTGRSQAVVGMIFLLFAVLFGVLIGHLIWG
jgi:hypothetical protein